ncbi:MAG: carboxypeptidase-like regulatory domain-containing protein [Bryobacteraceae bacterium]
MAIAMRLHHYFLVPVLLGSLALVTLTAAQKKKVSPPPKYTISGTITGLGANHRARVVATSSNHPQRGAYTREDGSYTLQSVYAGSYSVRPTHAGYRFTPSFHTVAVTTADRVEINFVATPLPTKSKR